MNKIFLATIMLFAFTTTHAEEQNSSNPEIIIKIDKNALINQVKKSSSVSFGEKIFNIGGEVVYGAGMGVIIGAALMLYQETVAVNNAPSLQAGFCIVDKNKWNEKVAGAVASGAAFGGLYGFFNGVYKNFVKS